MNFEGKYKTEHSECFSIWSDGVLTLDESWCSHLLTLCGNTAVCDFDVLQCTTFSGLKGYLNIYNANQLKQANQASQLPDKSL